MKGAALVLFSRPPEDARAKSRLRAGKVLTDEEVNRLHQGLVLDTVALVERTPFTYRAAAWSLPYTLSGSCFDLQFEQHGENFGEMFQHALHTAFDKFLAPVVIIGSDCPQIGDADLTEAADAVTKGHAVIGPSPRGGFYLLGIPLAARNIELRECFRASNEFESVLARLESFPVVQLSPRIDLDTDEDIRSIIKPDPQNPLDWIGERTANNFREIARKLGYSDPRH